MFCKDLTLHIITISVLSGLFLVYGAEVDAKYRYDDLKPHIFTPRPFWERFTDSPYDRPNRYSDSNSAWIIFFVFVIFIVIAFIGIIIYRSNCCELDEHTVSSLNRPIVHPPPRAETSRLPPSNQRPPNQRNSNRVFTSPRSSSSSFILSPEERQHVIIFASAYEIPDSPPHTSTMDFPPQASTRDFPPQASTKDNPPDYSSVVTSDLSGPREIKYPTVKLEPVLDNSPPSYDDYKSMK